MVRVAVWRSEQNLAHHRVGTDLQWGIWGLYGVEESLRQLGVSFDVVGDGKLDGYELLICPEVPIVTPEQRKSITDFVAAGGKLLTDGTFSLYQDEELTPYPDSDDLLGTRVQASQINPYFDGGEPNFSGHLIHGFDQGDIFCGIPRLLPVFGRTRILAAEQGAESFGTFEGASFKGNSGDSLKGAACILNKHGQGRSLCVSPRIFRTLGILLSSQTSPDFWVSRTEYFPSADNQGGVHGWEHNAICRALQASGWAGFPVGAYYQRLLLNLINTLCPDLPRVSNYPDGKQWAFVVTFCVSHAGDADHADKTSGWGYADFDRWGEINKELGIHPHASWFFEAHLAHLKNEVSYPHPFLTEYDIADARIAAVMAELRKAGYEVCLFHCHWDDEVIRKEAERFRKAAGFAPVGTRAHYLVDSPRMMESLDALDFIWDSSSFNHKEIAIIGGVYNPTHPLDCRARKALSILEIPACFTDGQQIEDMYGLHPPVTNERLAATVELLKELNGVMVVGFHPHLLPISETIYRYLVNSAKEHKAWIVTGEELTKWWVAREHIRIEQREDGQVVVRYQGPAELLPYAKKATITLPNQAIPVPLEQLWDSQNEAAFNPARETAPNLT